MNFIFKNCPEFAFREGKYEAGNDKTAIELLIGDNMLLNYIQDKVLWDDVKEHMKIEEQKWIRKVKKTLLYDMPLFRSK
jgi:hypothetical protein